jgi:hypothetical protein
MNLFKKLTACALSIALTLSLCSFNPPEEMFLVTYSSCSTSGTAGMTQTQINNFVAQQTQICGQAPSVQVHNEK